MDNGRGRSRLNLFRHLHEIQSGHTSSISHELLGFSSSGQVINYSNCQSTEQICELSSKLITLIDLAGHQKYIRTTVFGLTCYQPDIAMLVVSGNAGIVETAREHLGYAIALKIPICVVVTKIDVCPPAVMARTLEQVQRTLKSPGCNKVPMLIKNEDDVVSAAANFKSDRWVFIVCSFERLALS
jgi:GTPase